MQKEKKIHLMTLRCWKLSLRSPIAKTNSIVKEKQLQVIPIIMWHKIEDTPDPYCTSLALFDLEMKYLA